MKKLLLMLCLGSIITANIAKAEDSEVKIVDGTIFIAEKRENGQVNIKKANVIPYKVGQEYGWILKLNTNEKVKVTEEFILPAKAKTWKGFEETHAIADNKSSILKKEMKPENNIIMNAYGIAEGDPKGTYTFNIWVNDKLHKSFKFLVN